jgi:hypothetical protein
VERPTYVWTNAGHYPLHVPIDGGDVAILAGALVQWIQWPKDRILIPPMTRHPVDSRLSHQSSYRFASGQIHRRSQGTLLPSSGTQGIESVKQCATQGFNLVKQG